jgi:hypothetical protein
LPIFVASQYVASQSGTLPKVVAHAQQIGHDVGQGDTSKLVLDTTENEVKSHASALLVFMYERAAISMSF